MKAGIRFLSIFALIGGLFILFVAGEIIDANEPTTITSGIIVNGEFVETDTGQLGGNQETQEEMGYLQAIGVVIMIIGAGGLVASFFIKN